jgi:K+-transporting ATPase KdpF subunit
LCASARRSEERAVAALTVLGGALALGLLVYLFVALLLPEKLS